MRLCAPLLLVAWLASPVALARQLDDCITVVTPPLEIMRIPEETSYRVKEGEFYLNFRLGPGVKRTHLTYEIRVTNSLSGQSAVGIEPQNELKEALAHFGDRVEAIDAFFNRGSPEMTEYVAARRRGLTPRRAALDTWVGREAAARGYTVVEISRDTQLKIRAWGRNGEPESLAFRFQRPEE